VRHAYGAQPEQFGELTLPAGATAPLPVAVLLHGGFWRAHRTLDLMRPLVAPLVDAGLAVWNLEYRRVGQSGGGWPGTMHDVAAGVDRLLDLGEPSARLSLDLDRVVLVGHSAGGQLALWAASRRPLDPPEDLPQPRSTGPSAAAPTSRRLAPCAVVSLAGLCDLVAAADACLGRRAVERFLGGRRDEVPGRYRCASPVELVPLGVPQVLVHGDADDKVPATQTRAYVDRARAVGDDVALVDLPSADHMAVIEPDVVLPAVRRAMVGTSP
jgi:acetyl esterase/lipase